MTKNKVATSVLFLIALCFTLLMTACEEEAAGIRSSWRDREIYVDGIDPEWKGCPKYYDEDTMTSVSLLNDENHLFIRVTTQNQEIQRQILIQGLTVWFEQKGEKKRKMGVHFPVGIPREKRMQMFRDASKDQQDPFRGLLEKGQREIQLLGPGEYEQKTMPVSEIRNYDMDVKINKTERDLVYELKIPITKTEENRHAFLHPGKESFRLGFQVGDREKEIVGLMGHQTPLGEGNPDSGELKGPRGKGGKGKPGDMGKERPKGGKVQPLELWLKVTLADNSRKTTTE